jgi:acyl-CoA-binding protein
MGQFISRPATKFGIAAFLVAYIYLQYTKKTRIKDESKKNSTASTTSTTTTTTTSSTSTTTKASATPNKNSTSSTPTPTPTPTPVPPPKPPLPPVLSSEEIDAKFVGAQDRWTSVAHKANEVDKKYLYGLYKFILEGPPTPDHAPPQGSTDRPRLWKWEAWSGVTCPNKDAAKLEYANLVFAIGARGTGGLTGVTSVLQSPSANTPVKEEPSLDERFKSATSYIKKEGANLSLGSTDLLELYGFFKQATIGKCNQPGPSMWHGMEKKAKWNAWNELGNMNKETAMLGYINKVTSVAGEGWESGGGDSNSSNSGGSNSKKKKSSQGMGLNVSVMAEGKQSNDGTTVQDWKSLEGLHAAAQEGNVDAVRQILSSDSTSINAQNEEGMTALHWACDCGHSEVVSVLLKENASLEIKEKRDGMTPLHFAIPNEKVAELLILAGADVNAKDNDGISCLDMCDDPEQGEDRMKRGKVERLLAQR